MEATACRLRGLSLKPPNAEIQRGHQSGQIGILLRLHQSTVIDDYAGSVGGRIDADATAAVTASGGNSPVS